MKILVINGSPSSTRSNTLKLTNTFVEGLNQVGEKNKIDFFDLSNTKIDTCRGCRECFSKTPGECSINDDMSYILRAYIAADVVVWSFPLHNFGVPAKVKTVIDRLLPLYLPFIEKDDNDLCKRPYRYDFSNKKYVIISTCDYPNSKQNYESVLAQFDLLYGKNYSKIICPEGELFSMPQFEAETTAYLSAVKDAGADFAKNGKFQNKTIHNLIEIMVEPTRFINVSNSNWNIKLDAINANEFEMDPTEKLVRQLAIAYNTQFFKRKIIFEIYFTDLDKTYQLYLGATACTLKTEIFQRFNTRIDVDFDTLSKITDHTLSCSEALNDGLLKVEGDFSTMVRLDDLFGLKVDDFTGYDRRPSMLLSLLLPFTAFALLACFLPSAVVSICLLLCALVPVAALRFKPVEYENVMLCCVPVLCVLLLYGTPAVYLILAGFIALAITAFYSTLKDIPLSAPYLTFVYGGTSALDNPLYITTSRVLSAVWGGFFVACGLVCTLCYLLISPFVAGISVIALLVIATIFTACFIIQYPAHLAHLNIAEDSSTETVKFLDSLKEKAAKMHEEKKVAKLEKKNALAADIAENGGPRRVGGRQMTLAQYKARQLEKKIKRERFKSSFTSMKNSVSNLFNR